MCCMLHVLALHISSKLDGMQQELLPPQPQLSWKRQRAKLALLRVRDDASEFADRDGGTAVFIFVPPRS